MKDIAKGEKTSGKASMPPSRLRRAARTAALALCFSLLPVFAMIPATLGFNPGLTRNPADPLAATGMGAAHADTQDAIDNAPVEIASTSRAVGSALNVLLDILAARSSQRLPIPGLPFLQRSRATEAAADDGKLPGYTDDPLLHLAVAALQPVDPFRDECDRLRELARKAAIDSGISASALSVEAIRPSSSHPGSTTRFMVVLNGSPSPETLYQAINDATRGIDTALVRQILSEHKLLIQVYYQKALCVEFLVVSPSVPIAEGTDSIPLPPQEPGTTVEVPQPSPPPVHVPVPVSIEKTPPDTATVVVPSCPVQALEGEADVPREAAVPAAAPATMAPAAVTPAVPVETTVVPAVPGEVGVPATGPASTEEEKTLLAQAYPEPDTSTPPPEEGEYSPAYLSIILDDGGYGGSEMTRVMELDNRLSLAILPDTPFARETVELAVAKGFEIMLHMPMQAGNGNKHRFPGELRVGMTREQIQQRTRECIAQFPEAVGVNNHTGGLFTTCEEEVGWFLEVVKAEGLFFVDSRTIGSTCAYRKAVEMGIPTVQRDLFLDHSNSLADIRKRFKELVDMAKKHGWAVGIGHFRPNTITVLSENLPGLAAQGVELVPASEMVW